MKVLIAGADLESKNLGVVALAEGISRLAESIWPDAEIEFATDSTTLKPSLRDRAIALELLHLRGDISRWLKRFDLVIDMRGGDSFTDIYGLRRLVRANAIAGFARRAGVPVVMGPQTIGPFDSRIGRALGRRQLRRSNQVLVRDAVSAAYCRSLGLPADALTTDVVFALDVPTGAKNRDVVLNVSGLLWNPGPHVDHNRYREVIARLYERLIADGRSVTLFSHVIADPSVAGPDNDVTAVEEFAATLSAKPEIYLPTSLADVRSFISSAELVIASRMHACLNALSMGTPAIPLAYSRKFAPLLDGVGWPHSIDLRTAEDAADEAAAIAAMPGLRLEATAVRQRADGLLDIARRALHDISATNDHSSMRGPDTDAARLGRTLSNRTATMSGSEQ